MNLKQLPFSIPPRNVPFSRKLTLLLGNPMLQLFTWGGVGLILLIGWSINWDNTILHPSVIDYDLVKQTYTEGILRHIEPETNAKSLFLMEEEKKINAYHYTYSINGVIHQGVSYTEAELHQIGQVVSIRYIVGNPVVSCVEGMRSRPGNPGTFIHFFLMMLVSIIMLLASAWWNLNRNYLIAHGYFAIGTLEQQSETMDEDDHVHYKVQYTFQAFNKQFYPVEETLLQPATQEDIVILYKADWPQHNVVVSEHTLQEYFDENFQPLPSSWENILLSCFIPVFVIMAHILIYIKLYH